MRGFINLHARIGDACDEYRLYRVGAEGLDADVALPGAPETAVIAPPIYFYSMTPEARV